jgi:phytoene/squalene synthetase
MTVPELSAPARLVRQMDPDLFHAALFAPEPARERLMVLYAFDIELSRAAETPSEPLIARMRLQFWRDALEAAKAGGVPPQHEVAEPLHRLVAEHALPAGDLAALVDAREMELHGGMDEHRFADWLDARFGALTRLAVALLAGDAAPARRAASAVGQAMGTAFALRTAAPMAAEGGPTLMPGLGAEDLSALARGHTSDHARGVAHRLADRGLGMLAAARAERSAVPKAAAPALLPVWRAERVLKRAQEPGLELATDLAPGHDDGARPFNLAWRALSGRW